MDLEVISVDVDINIIVLLNVSKMEMKNTKYILKKIWPNIFQGDECFRFVQMIYPTIVC